MDLACRFMETGNLIGETSILPPQAVGAYQLNEAFFVAVSSDQWSLESQPEPRLGVMLRSDTKVPATIYSRSSANSGKRMISPILIRLKSLIRGFSRLIIS